MLDVIGRDLARLEKEQDRENKIDKVVEFRCAEVKQSGMTVFWWRGDAKRTICVADVYNDLTYSHPHLFIEMQNRWEKDDPKALDKIGELVNKIIEEQIREAISDGEDDPETWRLC